MIPAYEKLSALVRRSTGIVLDPDKQFIAETRLLPLARARGHENVARLIDHLVDTREPSLEQDVIDALATNETFFFRDRAPFDLFAQVILPYLLTARNAERALRIWCAACSTGQEPYSLAMTIDEQASRLTGWRIDLRASDVSRSAIRAASDGVYNQFEVQRGLPARVLLRYFTREGEQWRIAEHLRSKVRFSHFNLLRPFDEHGQFDVIFCRNVLIYFDPATRRDILARLARSLRKDGFLILGSTETISSSESEWSSAAESPMLHVLADGPHATRPAVMDARAV